MKIVRAERIALNLPFYHRRVSHAMHRASTHGERVWVVRLEADNGLVGWGDDLGWDEYWDFGGAPPPRPTVDHLIGCNPMAVMFDDGLGFAAQVAVLDLVARDNGVPVHALLGQKVRDRCPISWWDIDMPPTDWAAEARESVVRGYASFKMKARPWRDIFAQVEAAAAVVPGDYKFDIDFNGFLLDQAGDIDFHPAIDTVLCDSVHILNHELAVQHLPTRMYQRKRKGAVMGSRFTNSHRPPGPANIINSNNPLIRSNLADSTRATGKHWP